MYQSRNLNHQVIINPNYVESSVRGKLVIEIIVQVICQLHSGADRVDEALLAAKATHT